MFSPITSVHFSPHRSPVFAASSLDGFIYIFDLSVSPSEPVDVLEVSSPENSKLGSKHKANKRIGVVGISFNHKYKFLAACDVLGQIHVWRLSWRLSTKQKSDEACMNDLVNSIESSIRSA
jgi:WD40 repeat protein